jgi:glycosyltransferase involved in cell wall biosynthesis
VAVIGAIGRHKGHEILLRCAQAAAKENLPLHFAILGFTADDRAYSRCDNVSISGAYRREDLPGLITASGARVALFLSPWPETYCFALTDAWRNNLFPVALDIGAVAERIRATGCGLLLPLNAEPKVINRALMDLFEQNGADWSPVVSGFELPDILGDYYGLAVASEPEIPAPRLLRPGQERLPGSVQLSELKGVA